MLENAFLYRSWPCKCIHKCPANASKERHSLPQTVGELKDYAYGWGDNHIAQPYKADPKIYIGREKNSRSLESTSAINGP